MSSKRRGPWLSAPRTKADPSTPASNDRSPGTPKPRGPLFWISAWWPVAVGIALIATESTAAFGADRTSGPLRRMFEAIFGQVNPPTWDLIHHYLRKSGHFVGYGGLGLAWLRAWWMSLPGRRFRSRALLAMLGTALVATWDEWHQSFLPNRTASPWDVLLDCCGAAAMIAIVYFCLRVSHSRLLGG